MCFSITIEVPRAVGEPVESAINACGPLQVWGASGVGAGSESFFIDIREELACGCSMLVDTPQPEPGVWKLRDDIVTMLTATLGAIAGLVDHQFELVAVFSEELPLETVPTDLESFLATVERNELRDKTKYVVARRELQR